MFDDNSNPGYQSLTGKTASTPTISGTTALGISFGQSLDGNHSDGTYTPANPTKIHNLNPYSGLFYRSLQPLLGCSGGAAHWWPETQDLLVTNAVFTDVILCPIAIAGVTLNEIATGWTAYRTVVAILRCRAVGMPITFYHCNQGQSGPGTTAAWKAQANIIRDTIAGMNAQAPIFLDKSTMLNGVVTPAIQTAVDELVAEQPTIFKAGADTDSIPAAFPWRMDGTHLAADGNHAQAALEYAALNAVF